MLSFDDFSYLVPLLNLSGPVYQTLAWAIYDCLDARERQTRFIDCLSKNCGPTEQDDKGNKNFSFADYKISVWQADNGREVFIALTPNELELCWSITARDGQLFLASGKFSCFGCIRRDRFFSILYQFLPPKD